MSEPRTVVIGYGYAGRAFHGYLIGLNSGLKLHGIASRDAQTRQRIVAERGCRAYESFEQVLADPQVDLIVLATPHSVHAPQAIAALDAGKHVVTDKVMCTSLAECDAMIAAAERNKRLLTVFHNRRWDGDYLTVKSLLDSKRLGEVRWMELAWNSSGPPSRWRGQKAAGGGRLFDLGAHMLDQLLLLMPHAVTSVHCRMQYDYPGIDVESHCLLTVGFANGATGIVDTCGMNAIRKPRFYLCGRSAAFIKHGLDPQEGAMNQGRIDEAVDAPETFGRLSDGKTETVVATIKGRWRSFYENVAAVLAGKSEPAVTLPQMRRLMQVFDAARRSADTGQVITTM